MNVDRRMVLAGGGVLAASSAFAASVSAKQGKSDKSKKATYVLVHGGGHGGWCWKRVATPLREAGHRVYTPTMTGLGERSHILFPEIDLDFQITDIVNVLKWEDLTDVILVGHSYGGMVITGVADRALDRIGQLVYLDAAHPKNGDPLWGASPEASSATNTKAQSGNGGNNEGGGDQAQGVANAMINMAREVNGVKLILFPTEQFINGPLGVTNPDDVAWLMSKLTPHPLKCFTQPLQLENEAAIKKIPTTDIWRKMILENLAEGYTSADRIWSIDSPSHDLMVTDPKPVTDMLLKLA